jgi:ketosteroid isomerase-like protein
MTDHAGDFGAFMRLRERAAAAYVDGDGEPVDALATDTAPASFFGPDGGVVADPAAIRSAYRAGAEMFAGGGESRLEVLDARASGDVAYWCGIQHATVRLAADGSTVEMPLRITEIFRRENSTWRLVHRHADQLRPADEDS